MDAQLKIGLIVDGATIKGWQFSIVQQLLDDDRFDCVALIELLACEHQMPGDETGLGGKVWRLVDRCDAWLANRLFGKRWRPLKHGVDADVELSRLGQSLEIVRLCSGKTSDAALLADFGLDVLVNFTSGDVGPGLAAHTRFGVWSLDLGAPGLLGFWEVFRKSAFSTNTLQVRPPNSAAGTNIRLRHFSTFPLSWNENRKTILWKSRFLMIDALSQLARTRTIPTPDHRESEPFGLDWHRRRDLPTAFEAVLALARCSCRIFKHILKRRLTRDQWQLIVRDGPLDGRRLSDFNSVAPPNNKSFWADPFLTARDGATWIFFEDLTFSQNRGLISCVRLIEDSFYSFQTVLDRPYHLSYPFLFEHGGDLYMLPETRQNGTVELWKCVEFPGKWELTRTIFENISAVDGTILEHDGRWWLFTNIDRSGLGRANRGVDYDELFIYHTDDPINGTWQPHAANPIVTDARWGRMGGAFMRTSSGRLLRCAQIGGLEYGSGLAFLEVKRLSESAFEERPVESVYPHWRQDLIGIHHCCRNLDTTVFDVCVRVPRR